MRKVGKILGRSFLVLVLFTSLAFAPKEPVDRGITFDPAHLGDDLDAYLAPHEAKFSDIIPTTQKEIVWAGDKGAKAPSFTIPIHGFSATKFEIRPVPDRVAAVLGANLFYTRLAARGGGFAPMAEPTAGDILSPDQTTPTANGILARVKHL